MKTFAGLLGLMLALGGARAAVLADLPYRLGTDRRIVTDVTIDGKGPFSFMLDTAASRTMLYERVRAKLNLTQSGSSLLTVFGIENVGTAMPVKPQELRIADEAIRGLVMGVLPDDREAADGVLGLDALSRYTVLLDRDTMRLNLLTPGDKTPLDYHAWSWADLSARPLHDGTINFWTMRTSIRGTNMTTILDMGAGMTMLNWAAAEKLGYRRTNFPSDGMPQKLRDALGTVEPVGVVRDVTIWAGGKLFSNQTVIVANAAVFRYFGLDTQPAAIAGPGLLGDRSLAIDFAGRRLYIGPKAQNTLQPPVVLIQ
jgi:predicted aspartyl protease